MVRPFSRVHLPGQLQLGNGRLSGGKHEKPPFSDLIAEPIITRRAASVIFCASGPHVPQRGFAFAGGLLAMQASGRFLLPPVVVQ